MKKENLKFLFIGIFLILSFITVDTIYSKKQYERESEYIKSIGLNLQGRVTKKTKFRYGHNYGVVHIKLSQSNIKNYDERKNSDRHIGFIVKDKAEIIFNSMSNLKIGDSISIYKNDFQIYRMENLVYKGSLSFAPARSFYKEYNKKHKID